MSTYEALLDLHLNLTEKAKSAAESIEVFSSSATMLLELDKRGIVTLNNSYKQQFILGRRSLAAARKLLDAARAETDGMLAGVETARVQFDLAFALNETALMAEIDKVIDGKLLEIEDALQEAFTLLEEIDKTIQQGIPKLLVA